jgi:hypothetical protein
MWSQELQVVAGTLHSHFPLVSKGQKNLQNVFQHRFNRTGNTK